MTALRSRRLEALLGEPVDQLTAEHLQRLVLNNVAEEFDLDFKQALYGRGDSDRRSLAGDVCALANTAGGVILIGVEEDDQARAVAAPGVDLADVEVTRMRQIVGSLAAPMPPFEIYSIPDDPASPVHGYYVVAVPRSSSAPHATIVNEALRFPRRNGATTRYLSEPELAAAYRDRLFGAAQQADRIVAITNEALQRIDLSDPYLAVSLVPDVPGDFIIARDAFERFRQGIVGQNAMLLSNSITFLRANVGQRRFLADGGGVSDEHPIARWASVELHTDGSGVYVVRVAALSRPHRSDDDRTLLIDDEWIALGIVSGLLRLAQHARDRAAAGGNVLVRVQLVIAGSNPQLLRIAHTRQFGLADARDQRPPVIWPKPAEAAADLDDLAQPGPPLIAAAAALLDELGQGHGVPEMGQLSRDGEIRRKYWGANWNRSVTTWAAQHGIKVTDETPT
jgi:hypothetical protein